MEDIEAKKKLLELEEQFTKRILDKIPTTEQIREIVREEVERIRYMRLTTW